MEVFIISKNTRENILNMSHKLFTEKGYDQTKVEDICDAVGTAKGSFFYYFDKKETVVEVLLDMQVTAMSQQLAQGLKHIPTSTDKMSALMTLLLMDRQAGPPSLHYFKGELPRWFDTLSHQKRDQLILPMIQSIVEEGCQSGEFVEACTDMVTEIIYLGISQLVHRHYEDFNQPDYMSKSITSFEYVLNTVLATKLKPITISPDPKSVMFNLTNKESK